MHVFSVVLFILLLALTLQAQLIAGAISADVVALWLLAVSVFLLPLLVYFWLDGPIWVGWPEMGRMARDGQDGPIWAGGPEMGRMARYG